MGAVTVRNLWSIASFYQYAICNASYENKKSYTVKIYIFSDLQILIIYLKLMLKKFLKEIKSRKNLESTRYGIEVTKI